jgi:hypothetical protein
MNKLLHGVLLLPLPVRIPDQTVRVVVDAGAALRNINLGGTL